MEEEENKEDNDDDEDFKGKLLTNICGSPSFLSSKTFSWICF